MFYIRIQTFYVSGRVNIFDLKSHLSAEQYSMPIIDAFAKYGVAALHFPDVHKVYMRENIEEMVFTEITEEEFNEGLRNEQE